MATGCLAKCGVKPDETETEKNVEDGTFENPAYIEESEINTQNNDGKKPPPRLSTVDLNDEKITGHEFLKSQLTQNNDGKKPDLNDEKITGHEFLKSQLT